MPPAANLTQAANESTQNLLARLSPNTLKADLTAFWQAVIGTFPEQDANGHPVSNWLTVLAAFSDQLSATPGYFQAIAAAEIMYRLCLMTNYLASVGLITAAQATTGPASILVQYNALIA